MLTAWKLTVLLTCLAVVIAGLFSLASSLNHLGQVKKNISRLNDLTAQVDSLSSNIQPGEHYVNWFNFYLGATAIPSLSSPHHMDPARTRWWPPLSFPFSPPEKKTSLEQELLDLEEQSTNPDGPNAPLVPTSKEYKVPPYCVASGAGDDKYVKLQLAIKTPRPIIPLELTMEHYPDTDLEESGVKSRAVAPKQFELWVHIINPSTYAAVLQNITSLYPTILKIADPPSPPYLKADSAQALDLDNWVPIGRWEFAMLSPPYKKLQSQKFQPQVNVEELRAVTDMFLVMVNTNWGDMKNTCLVRVRMRGLDRSATFEYCVREDVDS